ncbi:hypothetical protein GCM10022224_080110 [Nonomuraea antimicrobica]|uniref:Uncharacterized protein n=1 Tax=Nonomuraea antimicrobica TaxID=561173 RepID=A0ABP7DCB4_9ACTN
MAQPKRDAAYDKTHSRLTREAHNSYVNDVDSGAESPSARRAYDMNLRRSMPVDGKGRQGRRS